MDNIYNTTPDKVCAHKACINPSTANVKLKRCGACHVKYYCSVECQKAAWKAGHKLECQKIREPWKFENPFQRDDEINQKRGLVERIQYVQKLAKISPETDSNGVRTIPPQSFALGGDYEEPPHASEIEFLPPYDPNILKNPVLKELARIGHPLHKKDKLEIYLQKIFSSNRHTDENYIEQILNIIYCPKIIETDADGPWFAQMWSLVVINRIFKDRPASEHTACLNVLRRRIRPLVKMLILATEIDEEDFFVGHLYSFFPKLLISDDKPLIDYCAEILLNQKRNQNARCRVVDLFAGVLQDTSVDTALQKHCINHLLACLSSPGNIRDSPFLMACIVSTFSETKTEGVREAVCRAFELNCIDLDVSGGYGSYLKEMNYSPTEHERKVMQQSYRPGDPTL